MTLRRKQIRIFLDEDVLDLCSHQSRVTGMSLSDTIQIAIRQHFAQTSEAPHSHEPSQ